MIPLIRNQALAESTVEGASWRLTRCQDAVDELLPSDLSILVLVNAPEEVHDARLLVVHPAHVLFPPYVKVEVGKLLKLKIQSSLLSFQTFKCIDQRC